MVSNSELNNVSNLQNCSITVLITEVLIARLTTASPFSSLSSPRVPFNCSADYLSWPVLSTTKELFLTALLRRFSLALTNGSYKWRFSAHKCALETEDAESQIQFAHQHTLFRRWAHSMGTFDGHSLTKLVADFYNCSQK